MAARSMKAPQACLGRPHARSLSLLVALYLSWASGAQAQYMFLDANGDGRNGADDRIPPVGWSKIDVWLDTTRNRDGSPSPPAGGETAPGIAAYAFLIQVGGAAVEWGPIYRGIPEW